jgi:hypothetical protein
MDAIRGRRAIGATVIGDKLLFWMAAAIAVAGCDSLYSNPPSQRNAVDAAAQDGAAFGADVGAANSSDGTDSAAIDESSPDSAVDAPSQFNAAIDPAGASGCRGSFDSEENGSLFGYVAVGLKLTDAVPGTVSQCAPSEFVVTLAGQTVTTSSTGFFEMNDITPGSYDLTITRPGYLTRTFQSILIEAKKFVRLGSAGVPVVMWAGDLDGDGTINMTDAMMIAAAWKATGDAPAYQPALDLNCDGILDKGDDDILASNFNTIQANYPPVLAVQEPSPLSWTDARISAAGFVLADIPAMCDGKPDTGGRSSAPSYVQLAFERRVAFDRLSLVLGDAGAHPGSYRIDLQAADQLLGGDLDPSSRIRAVPGIDVSGTVQEIHMDLDRRCARRVWRLVLTPVEGSIDVRELSFGSHVAGWLASSNR